MFYWRCSTKMAAGFWTNPFHGFEMAFKRLLNERMPWNFLINIKEKKRELRQSTGSIKLALTGEPNYESHFLKYAPTL